MKKLIISLAVLFSVSISSTAMASLSVDSNFCTASRDYAISIVEARAAGVTQEVAQGFASAKNSDVKLVQSAIITMAYAVPAASDKSEWKKLASDIGEMNYQMCMKSGVVK
jgi:hypothetical protein